MLGLQRDPAVADEAQVLVEGKFDAAAARVLDGRCDDDFGRLGFVGFGEASLFLGGLFFVYGVGVIFFRGRRRRRRRRVSG